MHALEFERKFLRSFGGHEQFDQKTCNFGIELIHCGLSESSVNWAEHFGVSVTQGNIPHGSWNAFHAFLSSSSCPIPSVISLAVRTPAQ
jgi:hypothetical protein